MSLITCCPACRTMFRVVPDQLKASQGWVRCGQCEQVFDATANLVQEPPALDSPLPPSAAAGALAAPGVPQKNWDEEMMAAEFGDLAHDGPPPDDLQLETPDAAAWRESLFNEVDGHAGAAPARAAPPKLREGFALPLPETPAGGPQNFADLLSERAQKTSESDDHAHLSFMRRSRWRHPAVRALLFLLSVVLLLSLALQIARHERDRLAAREPKLRSWLYVMCQQLDCTLEPLRQIESVVIDDSAFSKIRDEIYQLNLTLRNKASVDLALPAIELVLTDVQDQVLVRRVLQPQELGAAPGAVPGGLRIVGANPLIRAAGDFRATVLMEVKDGSGALGRGTGTGFDGRVAGYRLLAFYP